MEDLESTLSQIRRLLEKDRNDKICSGEPGSGDESTDLATILANGTAALLFFSCLCFAIYIFIKFLIIANRGQQRSMLLFYALSICDLSTRVAYFIMSCILGQWSITLAKLQYTSTCFSICVGVSHSQNLSRLILDLSAVKLETKAHFNRLKR